MGSNKGKRGNWMGIYSSNRPIDVLKLTEAAEANLSGVLGFTGKAQDGTVKTLNILLSEATARPTLTDYASTPIGTIILTPKIAGVFGYQHQAQSANPVVGDWAVIAKTTCV
jgi:hypothetical protein